MFHSVAWYSVYAVFFVFCLRTEDSVSETFQSMCRGFAVYKPCSVLEWVKASCLFTVRASVCAVCFLKSLSTSCLMLNSSVLLFLSFFSRHSSSCYADFNWPLLFIALIILKLFFFFISIAYIFMLFAFCVIVLFDLFFFYASTMISFIFTLSLSNLGLGHCLLPPVLRWVLMLLHKLLFHST